MTINKKMIGKICASYVLCWTFIPPMQVGTLYRLIAVMCAGIWILLTINKDYLRRNQWYLFWMLVSTLSMIILKRMAFSSGKMAITSTLQWIIMLLIGMIVLYYLKYDRDYLYCMYTVILVLVAVFSITTIQACIVDPYSSRIANSEWLETRFEGNENVGLYGYIFMAVFMEPCLLYVIKKKIKVNKVFNLFVWVDAFLIAAMVATAGYSLAITCTFFSCVIVILFDRKHIIRSIFVLAIIVIIGLNYKFIFNGIFDWMLKITSSNVVYQGKISEFQQFFFDGSVSGDLAERFKNYSGSWQSIINYPFIGCYFFGESGGGGHSFLLDSIGKFGWVIGTIDIYLILIKPFKMCKHKKKNILDYSMFVTWIVFLFFDPLSQELAISCFLIYPVTQLLADGTHINNNR